MIAYNDLGNSPDSSIAAVPYRPGGLEASPSAGVVSLSWSIKATPRTAFEVYRKTGACSSGGAFVLLATTGADELTYEDTGVVTEETYAYKVRTINESDTAPVALGRSGYAPCTEAVAQ